jgi:putative CocE/NonD family hydrolase
MTDDLWSGDLPAPKYTDWSTEKELFVTMRDGIRLSTDVLLPKGVTEKLPTVLVRTPYEKDRESMVRMKWVDFFLRQGYAVVLQNERGMMNSEGTFENYLQGAKGDGYDTIDWIVNQPWSNGKVGTIGCSSSAENQWPAAAANHPGHAAMIPIASGTAVGDIPGNDTRGAIYRGGVPLFLPWIIWYGRVGVSERPLPPPDSTQEQRIRFRNFYSLTARAGFSPDSPETIKHLPSKDVLRRANGALSPFDNYVTWTPADPGWEEVELIAFGDEPRVPALHLNTWHDIGISETVRLFQHLQDIGVPDQYLIVGPGPHCLMSNDPPYKLETADVKELVSGMRCSEIENMSAFDMANLKFGDVDIGDARYRGLNYGYARLFLAWFEHWLKGERNTVTEMAKVQLFIMGKGWIERDHWPLPGTTFTNYYLGAGVGGSAGHTTGTLSKRAPSVEGKHAYVYDPSLPTPSLGGGCCSFAAAVDQRPISVRKDVLVYRTPPLEEPVTIAGPVEVVLHVSSSAQDTDFIVRLVHEAPDGSAVNLNDDAFRVRYQEGFDKKVLMEPGNVYEIRLPNMVTGNRFGEGHRIRLEISSSSFPLYERNLNTGGNNYDESEPVIAENCIHHGGAFASHVRLPVIPD